MSDEKKVPYPVRITNDCRTPETATGKIGMYEGDFPRTVIIVRTAEDGEKTYNEMWYEHFMASQKEREVPIPCGDKSNIEPPEYYFVTHNPRIRLEDGSFIWGDQCWWSSDVEGDLAEQQQEVKLFCEMYAALLDRMAQEEKKP